MAEPIENCPICFEDPPEWSKITVVCCNKTFHCKCLQIYLKGLCNNTPKLCPHCRQSVKACCPVCKHENFMMCVFKCWSCEYNTLTRALATEKSNFKMLNKKFEKCRKKCRRIKCFKYTGKDQMEFTLEAISNLF